MKDEAQYCSRPPASLAQQVERSAVNRKVGGSIPSGSAFLDYRGNFSLKFEHAFWVKVTNLKLYGVRNVYVGPDDIVNFMQEK